VEIFYKKKLNTGFESFEDFIKFNYLFHSKISPHISSLNAVSETGTPGTVRAE